MANQNLKLSKQFTVNGTPLVGFSVQVTREGSNSPAALFGSSDPNTKRLPGNRLVTDATGTVAAYVQPGTYRMTLLAPNGTVLAQEEAVPRADNFRGNEVSTSGNFQAVPYAATVTPAITGDTTIVKVGQLTGACSVANPAGNVADHAGKVLVLMFEQDATGSRAVTFGSQYKAGANTGTTGRGATMFVCDGTNWLQVGAALTFR